MSQHKENPQAVLHSMLPELLPIGHAVAAVLPVEVVPASWVLPYPADHMRRLEDGSFEVQPFPSEEWVKPPDGIKLVHPIGQPLAPENCEVVVMVGTIVQDGLQRGILAGPGGRPKVNTSHVMHGELMRMPLVEWQKMHLGQLRGPVQ